MDLRRMVLVAAEQERNWPKALIGNHGYIPAVLMQQILLLQKIERNPESVYAHQVRCAVLGGMANQLGVYLCVAEYGLPCRHHQSQKPVYHSEIVFPEAAPIRHVK